MATDATIDGRLDAIEEAIKELKDRLEARPPASNWLDQVIGIFKDEPAFDEVVRLGREFRTSDRPEDAGR